MSAVEQFEVGNLTVKIFADSDPITEDVEDILPTSLGGDIIVCSMFHRTSPFKDWCPFDTNLPAAIKYAEDNKYVVYTLWRYEHGQVAYNITSVGDRLEYPFNCEWDSGTEGIVLVKAGLENVSKKVRTLAATLTDWTNGSYYGYTIEDKEGEEVYSCWGFLGYDYCMKEAKEEAEKCAATSS